MTTTMILDITHPSSNKHTLAAQKVHQPDADPKFSRSASVCPVLTTSSVEDIMFLFLERGNANHIFTLTFMVCKESVIKECVSRS